MQHTSVSSLFYLSIGLLNAVNDHVKEIFIKWLDTL